MRNTYKEVHKDPITSKTRDLLSRKYADFRDRGYLTPATVEYVGSSNNDLWQMLKVTNGSGTTFVLWGEYSDVSDYLQIPTSFIDSLLMCRHDGLEAAIQVLWGDRSIINISLEEAAVEAATSGGRVLAYNIAQGKYHSITHFVL